ncbi:hypothetical protein [Mucilaginibacter sp.]|uniref:hypothetical protein n=1 Tax=Mucilaginibacter sp. TaxID=1882438 RepID=UPI000CC1D8F6|nr:hypothetical protein [Mucilaginibacter sp.]PLW90872.1 MAG: hypothetical protein C0154_04105 [Mucilaginibacter sp.]
MKKLLSIICVAVITLTAASCKKETVVQPNTNTTKFFTVNSSQWQLVTDGGGSYVVDIAIPALDAKYSDEGAVLVYIAPPNSTEWEQIPETFNGRAYSFTHDVGRVSIYAQNPSGSGTPTVPPSFQVKVVLIDSNAN